MKLYPDSLTINMRSLSPGINRGIFELSLKEIDWNIENVEPGNGQAFIDLEVELQDMCIICHGSLDAVFTIPCARCLEQMNFPITEEIYRVYSWDESISEDVDSEPVTLSMGFSILDAAREAVILSIPGKPLCAPDCRGFSYI
ncbi:MAG: DUF177 domain-containing protein [Candidatus Fermentibacteraceae bacterium]|nr:DUF177 domain-containing protein [Candidatus Fermentibacteraceae bacterium]